MSTRQLVFNSNNLVNNGFNNTYSLVIGGGGANFKNCSIALSNISIYNSIFNINSTLYKNNTFSLSIPYENNNVLSYSTLAITLPNGYYSYNDIQNYVNNQMILIGAYLINSTTGVYWTGINFSANSVYYAAEIDLYPIYTPTTAATAGYTAPSAGLWSVSGTTGLPLTSNTIQIIINSAISSILGIPQATYPAALQTTEFTQLSTTTPIISPVESLFLRCNLCNNDLLVPQDILYNFSFQNTTFGQLVDISPNEYQWNKIPDQSVISITITIVDQLFNVVMIQDPNLVITLIIKDNTT